MRQQKFPSPGSVDRPPSVPPRPFHAVRKVVRTRKQDSVLLYHLLEAHEGLTAYSTLFEQGNPHYRDVELLYTPENESDVQALLQDWADWVQVMDFAS